VVVKLFGRLLHVLIYIRPNVFKKLQFGSAIKLRKPLTADFKSTLGPDGVPGCGIILQSNYHFFDGRHLGDKIRFAIMALHFARLEVERVAALAFASTSGKITRERNSSEKKRLRSPGGEI
jgi:hypothetical protein